MARVNQPNANGRYDCADDPYQADPIGAAKEKALTGLRRLREKVGGRNKLAKLLGVSGPYLGRVLRGEKPMTGQMIERCFGNNRSLVVK